MEAKKWTLSTLAVSGRFDAQGDHRDGHFTFTCSQGAQYDTDLLNSAAHQFSEFFLMLGGHFNAQGWTSHALSMSQNIFHWNCFAAPYLARRYTNIEGSACASPGWCCSMSS
jgi:hypothetical protein